MPLERKVRESVRHPRDSVIGFDAQYAIDYFIAMAEFKLEHPVRTGLTEGYTVSWIITYLVKNYNYMRKVHVRNGGSDV